METEKQKENSYSCFMSEIGISNDLDLVILGPVFCKLINTEQVKSNTPKKQALIC